MVLVPVVNAITPNISKKIQKTFSIELVPEISPYPTVVNDVTM